jgi:hypothetical protein
MAVTRKCGCGEVFITEQMNRAKCYTCSPARIKPKNQADTLPRGGFDPEAPAPAGADDGPKGELEDRIRKTLEAMELSDNWKAELVLGLARDLDRPGVTGAPRTSMTKQLFAIMDELEGRRPPKADAIDELSAEADRIRGLL